MANTQFNWKKSAWYRMMTMPANAYQRGIWMQKYFYKVCPNADRSRTSYDPVEHDTILDKKSGVMVKIRDIKRKGDELIVHVTLNDPTIDTGEPNARGIILTSDWLDAVFIHRYSDNPVNEEEVVKRGRKPLPEPKQPEPFIIKIESLRLVVKQKGGKKK